MPTAATSQGPGAKPYGDGPEPELFVSVDNKMGEPQEEKRFSSDDDSVDYEAESEENSDDDDDISIEECEINDKSTSVNTAQEKLSIESDSDGKYRVINIISYFVVLVVLGLPVWWFTTRVYRATLPTEEMTNVYVPQKFVNKLDLPLTLSTQYDILITFVNPEPEKISINLDGKDFEHHLKPFIESVSSMADFTVKSQWLYLTSLALNPKKNSKGTFNVMKKKLPYLITPLETKTWAHMSQRPSLNFVIYASRCSESPLQILDENAQPVSSNTFLSPPWGGIHFLSISQEDCAKGSHTPDKKRLVSIMVSQFMDLMGLKSNGKEEIRQMEILKAKEFVESTRRTLKSLAKLLVEISSIVISDEVARKINIALDNANKADEFIAKGDTKNALKHARVSFENSEAAFSDPSLLALLYFPDDQKYAVYIPLFLPIMIPVLMSITGAHKWIKLLRS